MNPPSVYQTSQRDPLSCWTKYCTLKENKTIAPFFSCRSHGFLRRPARVRTKRGCITFTYSVLTQDQCKYLYILVKIQWVLPTTALPSKGMMLYDTPYYSLLKSALLKTEVSRRRRWGKSSLYSSPCGLCGMDEWTIRHRTEPTSLWTVVPMDEGTIKTPNPNCRLYWCLIEFID